MLPQNFKDHDICILGLGYVGLTLAVAMADSGFRVHGLEVRQDVLDSLAGGEPHFWEPQLKERLRRVTASGAFSFSQDLDDDHKASVYIITVGTPLGPDGKAQLGSVQQATRQISTALADGDLVLLRSTVKLGTARNVVAPILQETGRNFDLAVCPERTLEGKALIELYELPQIVGADTPEVRTRCSQLFGIMTPTIIKLEKLEAAELVKLTDNTFRDVSFAFANEIAALCGAIGVSAHDIIRAGKLGYPRTNVAWPGPVGGPCLEKDPHILAESAREAGVDMAVTKAARQINEGQPQMVAERLKAFTSKLPAFPVAPALAIVGLAFKGSPPTDDLRGTMALPIMEAMRSQFPDCQMRVYDPVVEAETAKSFFKAAPARDLEDAFTGTDIVIMANNHSSLAELDLGAFARLMNRPGLVFDFWNMHHGQSDALPDDVHYLALGYGA